MVSPSKPHHSRVASQEHLHKCKVIKGPKPLTHFKFYLDIERHHIENKIEKTIRELGGSIEFFLGKNVTNFITDKPIIRDGKLLRVCNHYLSPSSLLLAQTKTPSPVTKSALNDLNISDEKAASSRPKSRADAMVQRARTTTQPLDSKSVQCATSPSVSQNPMQLAQSWGIPIWDIEKTLKFLDKVSLELKLDNQSRTTSSTKSSHHHHHHHHHLHKTANVKHLNGQYIKIESSQKHYRPYYQELSSWPTINFDCNLCPFQTNSDKIVQKNKNCDNHNNLKSNTTTEESKSVKVKVKPSSISKIVGDVTTTTTTSVPIAIIAKNNITNIINESTMTRKTRNKQVREAAIDACSIKTNNDDVKPNSEKCGYCEKCRVEYDVLAIHLQSKEHLNFVKNNDNYIVLDKLINSGSNVENFLRINSSQMIDESERNGLHSPKRDSLISTRVNYLSHTSLGEVNKDVDNATATNTATTTVTATAVTTNDTTTTIKTKSPKQINGFTHHSELSPSKVNSVRGKLPKYSPPITRRSQTKNSINVVLVDQQNNETNSKVRPEKLNSITNVDFKEQNELNFISKADNDVQIKSPKQKATINGKKKAIETPQTVNNVIDDSPVLPKRLVRAFPRYKVVDGEVRANNERTARNSKLNTSQKAIDVNASPKSELIESDKSIKDPVTGLIVKFKRVRESELSKLTFEADNFMFPKREEQPTDEDRQSTSEHDGEISSEILSSEISSIRDSFSASQNSSLNVSTTSDQFTSSGRRKKRRTQYDDDNFKSPAKMKQKFRASLIQSRLNSNKKSPAINGSQTPDKQLSRSAKMLAVAKTTKTRGRRTKKQMELDAAAAAAAVAVEVQADNSLDDRMGENSYIGGKLLTTDYFKNLKFSFERVPNNEPWYLTFQRQDEHCERMFEYWGNTAYRKLPYELGPLPPLEADCCLLSKLIALKSTKQRNRRSTKPGLSVPSDEINAKSTTTTSGENTVSSSSCCNANTSAAASKTTTNVKQEDTDSERRSQTSTLSQLLLADSSLNSISLPNAIPNKKKGMLLDAFGQPRKSPREHASTLASLSSLIQQRRNRIKQMNGGISPEKMPSYKAAVAAAKAAQQNVDARDSADVSESDDLIDDCESRLEVKQIVDTESKPMSSRRRLNQTPVFELNKTTMNGNHQQSCGGYSSMEQSDKIFRLRKGKRRQTESVSSNNESNSGKNDKLDDVHINDKEDKTKDADIPKMPVIEYVDPNKVARDLDDLLSNSYMDVDSDLNDIPIDCSDLILVNTAKDFVEIIDSVKDGPLTYRSLQRGKKRHINKTGWPSIPRKRMPKRDKMDDIESALSDVQNCESCHSDTENDLNDVPMDHDNDTSNNALEEIASKEVDDIIESPKNSPISFRSMPRRRRQNTNKTEDDNDEEKSQTLRQDRLKIRTPFCDDNAVQFIVSTSSSEKAENSDIFTVSSDSFLDTDVNNDTLTTAKSRFSVDSQLSAEDEEQSISDETTVNHESNWHNRSSLRSNNITGEVIKPQKSFSTVDESASLTTTTIIASTIPTTTTTTTTTTATTTTSILERTLKNMSTRSTYLRSPTLVKEPAFDLNLQPLVCVQKISEKDLPQAHWINNLSQTTTKMTDPEVVKPNNKANASLKSKISPRKLRKPRGRWYRER